MSLFGGKSFRLSDPIAGRLAEFFSFSNHAGKRVTHETVLELSGAWACVRLLAEVIATLPLRLYQRDQDGGRTYLSDHAVNELFNESPNADQTPVEYLESVAGSIALWGNSYSEISRSGTRLSSLNFLRPDLTTVERNNDGVPVYNFNDRGKIETLPEGKVWHIKGFGLDPLMGMSPITYARQTMGGALAADEVAAKFFANGMQASGFIESPQVLTDEQRPQWEKIIERFTGSKNAGKVMTLEGGFKWNPVGMPPEDAQLLETRAFNIEEVCRWFRVPPVLIGHSPKGQTMWGSGIEQIMIAFLTLALRPYLSRITSSVSKHLLAPGEAKGISVGFNVDALLQADSAARAQLYSSLAQNGISTRNELRALQDMPSKEGGEDLTVQSNMIRLQDLGENSDGMKMLAAVISQLANTSNSGITSEQIHDVQ